MRVRARVCRCKSRRVKLSSGGFGAGLGKDDQRSRCAAVVGCRSGAACARPAIRPQPDPACCRCRREPPLTLSTTAQSSSHCQFLPQSLSAATALRPSRPPETPCPAAILTCSTTLCSPQLLPERPISLYLLRNVPPACPAGVCLFGSTILHRPRCREQPETQAPQWNSGRGLPGVSEEEDEVRRCPPCMPHLFVQETHLRIRGPRRPDQTRCS